MQTSAFILVLLVGCSAAYYFLDGPPHRHPVRQIIPEVPPPEPKQLIFPRDIPISANDSNHPFEIPAFYQENPEPRIPKPAGLKGSFMVPGTRSVSRQAASCQMNYAFTERGQSIKLLSPSYPEEYPNNVLSRMCFSSPEGTTMKVTCDEFSVEAGSGCPWDYLGVGVNGEADETTAQKYCGSGPVDAPSSNGNRLGLVFRSDGSNPQWSGRSVYRFQCSIQVSGTPEDGSGGGGGNNPPSDCNCGRRNDGRIVGGNDARPNEFPWRCYLKTRYYGFFCGCSIISKNWILTAAHCTRAVMPLSIGDTLFVVVGDHDRTNTVGQQFGVDEVHDHPNYNPSTFDNDMSLLKLSGEVTYSSTISPVCLPYAFATNDFANQRIVTSGWGRTQEGGDTSNTLKEVSIPVLTTEQCSSYYPGQIAENMICTYEPGKDTCQGDSGGSIDWNNNNRYYAIGVVSWGIGCARENRPGVYAKTTKFLDWVQTTAQGESFCRS